MFQTQENGKLTARIGSLTTSGSPQHEQKLSSPTADQDESSCDVQALRREVDHWRSEALRLQEEATTSNEEVIHLQNTLELARSQHPSEDLCSDSNHLPVSAAAGGANGGRRRSNAPSFSESFLVPLPDDDGVRGGSVESNDQGTQTECAADRAAADSPRARGGRVGPSPGVTVIPHRHTELRGVIATIYDLMKLVEDAVAAGGDLSGSRFSLSAADSDFRMSRLSTGSFFQVRCS